MAHDSTAWFTMTWLRAQAGVAASALLVALSCRDATRREPLPRGPAAGSRRASRSVSPPLITNLKTFTGHPYSVVPRGFRLKGGIYSDRSYRVIAAPNELLGADAIVTRDADKNSWNDPLMTFDLTRLAQVFLFWCAGSFRPGWLSEWRPVTDKRYAGVQIVYEPVNVDVFEAQTFNRSFPAGPVSLGPIRDRSSYLGEVVPERFEPDDAIWMYFVVVLPAE